MGCEVFGKFVTIPKVGESGTDGCRVLCHQFSTSSLLLLVHSISRYKPCSLTTKHMTSDLLRLLVNGDQGQNSRTTVFPLNTGH